MSDSHSDSSSRVIRALSTNTVHRIICHECKPLHAEIIQSMFKLLDDPSTKKSHLFNNRYENIYINQEHIPTIKPVLQMILHESAKQLNTQTDNLQMAFWFNIMQKNDVTLPHRHDDDDELLSGTYYLQMPEQSGSLKITLGPESIITITPEEAALTCFHPAVIHEVTQHQSLVARISIGFNVGQKK